MRGYSLREVETGRVDFMAVQNPLFAVASKSFVIHRYENHVRELEYCISILNSIRDILVGNDKCSKLGMELLCSTQFRGIVRRFRKAIQEIRKHGGPLDRFIRK